MKNQFVEHYVEETKNNSFHKLRILSNTKLRITAQKMKFSTKDFFSKCAPDLVTFTEEILQGTLMQI